MKNVKKAQILSILCKDCFILAFEEEVHVTITKNNLFARGQKVAIGASGGKDSAVLMKVLQVLNSRYDYGYGIILDQGSKSLARIF